MDVLIATGHGNVELWSPWPSELLLPYLLFDG